MLSGRADAGQAGRLDTLSEAVDLNAINIQGDGRLQIDQDCHPPRMTWKPSQHTESNFWGHENIFRETIRLWEDFKAEAVASDGASKSTFGVTSLRELSEEPASSLDEKAQHRRTKYDAYMARIMLLKDEAVHDGYALNFASEINFQQFIQSAPEIRKGNLVLMDNGNLRAIWKDKQGTHLGLQFLGGRMVQYVIFKQREQGQQISRVTGRDSLEGFKRQIDAFGLQSLLSE